MDQLHRCTRKPNSPYSTSRHTDIFQVRCVFRTVELSEGFQGHLTTTESYFYALDVLPLLIALVIYIPFWPGRFIPNDLVMKDAVTEGEPAARNSMNEGTLNEVQRDVEKI